MVNFEVENQIVIYQIDNPHKFWYKKSDDLVENQRLRELEENLKKYATDLVDWQEHHQPINRGDEVVAFHTAWNKWIRGKAGKLKTGSDGDIFVWAIDYGCKLVMPLKDVYLLEDRTLACKNPINVHIGGLSGIMPAKIDLNMDTLTTEVVRCENWTRDATDHFNECILDRKCISFHVETVDSGRCFGQVLLHAENGKNNPFSVANALCEWGMAIRDKNYLYEVGVLDREDFLRLNHQMAFHHINEIEMADDQLANAERIFLDDTEVLSSLDLEMENGKSNQGDDDQAGEKCSRQNSRSHASSSLAVSGINGQLLSEETNTISVKLLNVLNVINISADEVTPAERWEDMGYFSSQAKEFLQCKIPCNEIDPQCSFGWPHIMRTNSLFLIGEPVNNLMLCLPTVCSIKQVQSSWSTSEVLEPNAIIFVTCAEEVELMAKYCRKMIQKSGLGDVVVYCLSSSFEIKTLIETAVNGIDILVAPVFCYEAIFQHMPKLSSRLSYVWFHQIDEMCRINEDMTSSAADKLLADDLDIQIVTSSTNFCPILLDLFDRAKVPMLSISGRSPFEAALAAKCHFSVTFEANENKIRRLIEKLQYRLNGSVVIMCSTSDEVKFVTGHLTQANIKCIDLDGQFSWNQMKLLKWSKKCLQMDTQSRSHLNILICNDETLEKFPIRSAQHIIHYSLPEKLETFKQRHITCYGFYEDRLRRDLLHRETNLQRPVCHVYFDDHLTEEYIDIFELLYKRTECQLPVVLIDTVQQMRFNFEHCKMKPLCGELLTRSADCDPRCPYRHTLLDKCNDTNVPEEGFVNMELLSVLAPNHFAVRIIGHKRCLEHKSKSLECLTSDWEQFEKQLREYYTNAVRENHEPIEIGDMCLIFHQSQPKRCRVISIERNCISVYLVDIGRVRNYRADQLYRLDVEFQDYPAQAIEIYVLGYLPADSNPKWLPEAADYTKSFMNTLKEERRTQNYLQAEVIKGFERTLLVKGLKMCFKGKNQLAVKSVSQKLIKSGFAVEAPIVLHDIFLEQNTDNESQADSEIIINHPGRETDVMQISRPPSSDGIQVTSIEYCENPPKEKMIYVPLKKRHSDSTTPVSQDENEDKGIGSKTDIDELDWDETDAKGFISNPDVGTRTEYEEKAVQATDANGLTMDEFLMDVFMTANEVSTSAERKQKSNQASVSIMDVIDMPVNVIDMPFIDFGTDIGPDGKINQEQARLPSLDEIFGSLPERLQTAEILKPVRCYTNGSPSNEKQETQQEPEDTVWLIDFND